MIQLFRRFAAAHRWLGGQSAAVVQNTLSSVKLCVPLGEAAKLRAAPANHPLYTQCRKQPVLPPPNDTKLSSLYSRRPHYISITGTPYTLAAPSGRPTLHYCPNSANHWKGSAALRRPGIELVHLHSNYTKLSRYRRPKFESRPATLPPCHPARAPHRTSASSLFYLYCMFTCPLTSTGLSTCYRVFFA